MRLFDKLTKQVGLLFISSMVVNVSNYLFQVFMGRSLGPADYGILASLFSLFMILSVPAGVLQTVTAKYTSNFRAHKKLGKIAKLVKGLLKRVSLFGLLGFILFIIASKFISSFLHIPSRLPVIITGVALIFAIILVMFPKTSELYALNKEHRPECKIDRENKEWVCLSTKSTRFCT